MVEKIRVILVDDHVVVRQGLQAFISLHDDIEIVGEAANGFEAIEVVEEQVPDVVLMDLVMPKMDGVEAIYRIKANHPDTKIIVLTSYAEDENIYLSIKAGAAGFLLKDVAPDVLVQAIRAVHGGEVQLHPDIAKILMNFISDNANADEEKPSAYELLTERELDILKEIGKGQDNKAIADALVISEKTVKTHINRIFGKLGFTNRTQAAIYAVKNKLVS